MAKHEIELTKQLQLEVNLAKKKDLKFDMETLLVRLEDNQCFVETVKIKFESPVKEVKGMGANLANGTGIYTTLSKSSNSTAADSIHPNGPNQRTNFVEELYQLLQ